MDFQPCPAALPRPCPACLGEGGALIFRQRFALIPGVSLHDGYPVMACQHCGAVYASQLPAQSHFDRYYTDLSKYQTSDNLMETSQADSRRFAAIAGDLAREIPWRDRRILDVGCGTGGLLKALGAEGFTQVRGLDPSPACVETARRQQLFVDQGVLFESLPGAPYDALLAIGVLEHIRDLDPAMARIREALKPNGILYVEVPDLLGFEMGNEAPFQDFSNEHITFFTERSLDRLLARHGFRADFGGTLMRVNGGNSGMRVLNRGYRKGPAPLSPPLPDEDGPQAAQHYLDSCHLRAEEENLTLEALAARRVPVAVWGAGALACRLMATTALSRCPIAAFVDSNPHLQGRELAGIPIQSSQWLKDFPGPILIASWGYAEIIQHILRKDLCLQNPVIRLDRIDGSINCVPKS